MTPRTLIVDAQQAPTPAAARAWAARHGYRVAAVESLGTGFRILLDEPVGAPAAADAEGDAPIELEVFATGTWRGHTFTAADLDQMVANFDRLRPHVQPPLKLGHDDQQQFLAQRDGQPALGWVDGLRRVGEKLVARVRAVPRALRALIAQERYKRVSAELYPAWEHHEAEGTLKTGVRGPVLAAVALLGADIPVVKTLDDLPRLLAMEGATFAAAPPAADVWAVPLRRRSHPPTSGGRSTLMDETHSTTDLAALRAELARLAEERDAARAAAQAAEAAARTQEQAVKAAEERTAELRERIARLEQEAAAERARREAGERALRCAEAERLVAELSSPQRLQILPAQRAAATALLVALPTEPTVRFGEGDQARDVSPRQLFEEFLRALPDRRALLAEVATAGPGPGATGDVQARLRAAEQAVAQRLGCDLRNREDRARVYAELYRTEPELVAEASLQPPVSTQPAYGRAGLA